MRGKFSHQVKGGTLKGVWVGELCTRSCTVVRLQSEEAVPRVSESWWSHKCQTTGTTFTCWGCCSLGLTWVEHHPDDLRCTLFFMVLKKRAVCTLQFLGSNSLRVLLSLKFRIMRQSTFKLLHDDSRAESGATISPFAPFVPRGLWQAIKSGSLHLINTKKKCLVGEWSGNVCEIK